MSVEGIVEMQESREYAGHVTTLFASDLPWHSGWFSFGRCKQRGKAGPYAGRCELRSTHWPFWHALERGMEMGLFK